MSGRNYAKATKGLSTLEILFFDDDLQSATPSLAVLKDMRARDGKIRLSFFERSRDPELEKVRERSAIGVVGEGIEEGV